jgi:hypothetical protein
MARVSGNNDNNNTGSNCFLGREEKRREEKREGQKERR